MAAEAVNQENGWMEKHRPEVFGVCQDDVVDIRLHTGPDSSGRMVPPSEPSRGVIDPSNRDLIVESERTIHFQGERQQAVNRPLTLLSCLAHVNLGNPYLNTLWLVVFTALMPALFASLYYGLIPIGNPYGSKRDRMAWVFAVNPCTQVLLSYTIITMFFGVLDESYPWRPFRSYVGILATTYVLQVLCPGLIVLLDETFEMCGLISVSLTVLVAAMGLYVSNSEKFSDNSDHYYSSLKLLWALEAHAVVVTTGIVSGTLALVPSAGRRQFWKVLITFEVFMMVLMLYIVANAKTDGWKQGIVTVSLSIVTFVFKKVLLSLTDPFPLEVAMAIAGLWLENLVDTFIVLAYPTTTDPGPTFAIIWATRVLENVAFLAFQTNAWFTFRVWIKSRFKKERKIVIRYDLNPDDRGHSNQRPGYRRRQLRFLIWKLLSSASASIFFLCLVPVLRYGWNRDIYPYQDLTEEQMEERYSYVHLKEVLQPLSHSQFRNAMIFTAAQLGTVAVSGVLVWTYMRVFVPTVLTDLFVKYQFLVVSVPYFGFVLTILVSNALLSVTSIQTYARVYWI